MGYHRFIQAALLGWPVTVYGDGQQVRGNTYVGDCVAATIEAVKALPGEVYNVGGGETASVWDILHRLEKVAGARIQVQQEPARPGDQLRRKRPAASSAPVSPGRSGGPRA